MKTSSFSPSAVCLTAWLLQGCAIVASVPAGNGGEGIAYMLPKALLPVELVDVGNALDLRIGAPVVVGDTTHTYALRRSGNVFTSDNVTISVDPSTGLLTAIDVKSDDKTVPAIVKLASARKAEAADASPPVVVFRGLFDPGWNDSQVEDFNRLLSANAVAHARRLKSESGCTTPAAGDTCKNILALDTQLASAPFRVQVEGAAGPARPLADCTSGFCYRMNVPHLVTLTGPGSSNSALFGLPNRSPTFVMPLERWAFVKTTHDVKLEAGVFKSITTERPSSALAVASAPLDVAKGVLGAVAEVVQLKVDLSGQEKALAEARIAEIEAQSKLEQALLAKVKGKAEAALFGADKTTGTVLSIRVGTAAKLDVNANLRPDAPDGGNPPPANPVPVPVQPPAPAASSSAGSAGTAGKP